MNMDIESIIEKFIVNELIVGDDNTKINPDESLISKGIVDSLALLQLISFIEDEFGVKIDDAEMIPENFQTINDMKALLKRKLQKEGRG